MKIKQFIINILGSLIVFIFFSLSPFISYLIDNFNFLLPWWGWGILGIVLFEVVYHVVFVVKHKE